MKPFIARADFGSGEEWEEREYTSLLAATIDQIGLGFRPFIRCEEKPHTFHILGLTTSPVGITVELPKIRMGLPLPTDKAKTRVTGHVEIESPEPFAYTIDGDMHRCQGRIVLEAGPRLEVIVK
jgi:hypothetical protein